MTVTNTTREIKEAGNGTKVAFTFPFKIFLSSDLSVYKVSAAGVATLQTLTTDYSVSINATSDGGTVTYVAAPTATEYSYITRVAPRTQGSALLIDAGMPEVTIENALDKLTMLVQEVDAKTNRAPLTVEHEEITGLVIDTPVDAKGLKWDYDSGTGKYHIASTTTDIDTAATAAAASAAAALVSQNAAAASASAASASEIAAGLSETNAAVSEAAAAASAADVAGMLTSGVYADRPASPASWAMYYSTDIGQLEIYIPVLAAWKVIGG